MSIYIIIYLAGILFSLLMLDSKVMEYSDMFKDIQKKYGIGIGYINVTIIFMAVFWPILLCYIIIDAINTIFFDNKH